MDSLQANQKTGFANLLGRVQHFCWQWGFFVICDGRLRLRFPMDKPAKGSGHELHENTDISPTIRASSTKKASGWSPRKPFTFNFLDWLRGSDLN
jgi:hypothetical protein